MGGCNGRVDLYSNVEGQRWEFFYRWGEREEWVGKRVGERGGRGGGRRGGTWRGRQRVSRAAVREYMAARNLITFIEQNSTLTFGQALVRPRGADSFVARNSLPSAIVTFSLAVVCHAESLHVLTCPYIPLHTLTYPSVHTVPCLHSAMSAQCRVCTRQSLLYC